MRMPDCPKSQSTNLGQSDISSVITSAESSESETKPSESLKNYDGDTSEDEIELLKIGF